MNTPSPKSTDHGKVVRAPGLHRIWAWVFPALAAAAGIWLLWSNWKSEGPEIEIRFNEAPGIQAGKTSLIFRGVTAGNVTAVVLDQNLENVVVRVRLKAFAAELASEKSEFWIDQPEISLRETTGLDAIIQGNSIHARMGGGAPQTTFTGLAQAPLTPLDQPSLVLRLRSSEIPFLGRGTPVYHRGIQVGVVRDKETLSDGEPYLRVTIDHAHKGLVRTNSRFWILPTTKLTLSGRGATLSIPGLDALVEGGVAFDQFSPDGGDVVDDHEFQLAADETAARMDGPEVFLTFDDARGLVPGETMINCFGYPVGLVESSRLDETARQIEATARIDSRFAHLLASGTTLTMVRPHVGIDGVSGIDTILTGPYIALEPGVGEKVSKFAVRSVSDKEWQRAESEREGINLVLEPRGSWPVEIGTPLFHRGLVAGRVTDRFLDDSGGAALRVVVSREFRNALTPNSRFWHVAAASASVGPGMLDFQVESLTALLRGGLAFESFPPADPEPVDQGAVFPLFATEAAARAVSPPVRITMENGQGLVAGKTQMRQLGLPVGLVEWIELKDKHVEITARFDPGHDNLRRKGAKFAIVQPEVSLQGVTGLETIISGVYLECTPGTGAFTDSFVADTTGQPEIMEAESRGFPVILTANSTPILVGAPVTYREMAVGTVVEKTLTKDGTGIVLALSIDQEYRHLVFENTVFWDAGDIEANIGFFKVKVKGQTVVAPNGKISFATPGTPGAPAEAGQTFPLSMRAVKQRQQK